MREQGREGAITVMLLRRGLHLDRRILSMQITNEPSAFCLIYLLVFLYNHAELFHTERSHVRNLKVLERVFYRPLLDHGFSDLVNLLFPNLPEMLDIHGRFNALMKARKREQPAVESVGDILVAMVSGSFLT